MKTEEDIKSQIKNSKYDPKKDPLMGRLFRKYDQSKSTIITKKHWKQHSMMEKFDNSKIY